MQRNEIFHECADLDYLDFASSNVLEEVETIMDECVEELKKLKMQVEIGAEKEYIDYLYNKNFEYL